MASAGSISKAVKAVVGRGLRETGAALKEAVMWNEIYTRHVPRMTIRAQKPFKTNDTFIAPNASVIGRVTNWDQSSVWYGAVVRADSDHAITIGFCSSVGENSFVGTLGANQELETGFPPVCHVGHYVTIGSGCVLKSCRIDDLVSIGDKCTILQGAIVEAQTILEPGTVVHPYQRVVTKQLWGGNPAKYIRDLTIDELESIQEIAEGLHYQAKEHLVEFLPIGNTYLHLEELEKQADVAAKQG